MGDLQCIQRFGCPDGLRHASEGPNSQSCSPFGLACCTGAQGAALLASLSDHSEGALALSDIHAKIPRSQGACSPRRSLSQAPTAPTSPTADHRVHHASRQALQDPAQPALLLEQLSTTSSVSPQLLGAGSSVPASQQNGGPTSGHQLSDVAAPADLLSEKDLQDLLGAEHRAAIPAVAALPSSYMAPGPGLRPAVSGSSPRATPAAQSGMHAEPEVNSGRGALQSKPAPGRNSLPAQPHAEDDARSSEPHLPLRNLGSDGGSLPSCPPDVSGDDSEGNRGQQVTQKQQQEQSSPQRQAPQAQNGTPSRAQSQPGAPASSVAASSPMRVDGRSGGGSAEMSSGSALGASARAAAPGAAADGAGSGSGSCSDVVGALQQGTEHARQLRHPTTAAAAKADAKSSAGLRAPAAQASASMAAADVRPSSPSSHAALNSGRDAAMLVNGADGSAMYGHAASYPYPYGVPPPYGHVPYGTPYSDPYYHPHGYPYNHMMDVSMQHASDPLLMGYGAPAHMTHPHSQAPVDPSAPRMLPYPGYMAPRQRMYRRFVTGPHGRAPHEVMGPAAADEPVPVGGSTATASAPPPGGKPQPAVSAATVSAAVTSGPSVPVGSSFGGSAASASRAGAAVHVAEAAYRQAPLSQAELEISEATRACHEQFAADEEPLLLSNATLDGIRQELRVVTQEFLQRRMVEAARRSQQPSGAAAAANGAPTAAQQGGPLRTRSGLQRTLSAAAAGAGSVPSHATSHDGLVFGGASASFLHKRGPSTSPHSAGVSPARTRPVLSAPFGGMPQGAPAASQPSGSMMADPAAPKQQHQQQQPSYSVAPAPSSGPAAMRQLFPAPSGVVFHSVPSVCGPAASHPAPGPHSMPGPAAAASAPVAPRPAMSGRSSVSAAQSAYIAHAGPTRAGAPQPQQQQQLPQPKGSVVMHKGGGYRVGQQGSMAAEVEDDGEEVHGPPQRGSTNRLSGLAATTAAAAVGSGSSSGASAATACVPPPPGVYYGMPPPPYDYPPGYYYPPPPMATYGGMRVPYGMHPSGLPPVPPGYRSTAGAGMPAVYGMQPPGMPCGTGPAPWPVYGMQPGAVDTMSNGAMRGSSAAAGAGPGNEYQGLAGSGSALHVAQTGYAANGAYL